MKVNNMNMYQKKKIRAEKNNNQEEKIIKIEINWVSTNYQNTCQKY